AQGAAIPAAKLRSTEGCPRLDEVGKFAAVLIFNSALLKIANNHFSRQTAVVVADADRSEQHRSLGMRRHETCDTLPQQKQRRVLPLILGSHKRAAQFQGGTDLQE